ncbi:MAG: DMT family transporter [Lachnospiraceae bacterium]|nr:DMT family transporter [Lachnospiraceae bacterium]
MGIEYILVIASAMLFGLMPILARQIYAMGGNPLSLCAYRFIFCLPFLYFMAKRKSEGPLGVSMGEAKKILLLSVGCATTPFLLFQSYPYFSSGTATTIHFVYPILVLLGSVLLFHAKMTGTKALCTALCAAGILFFYTPGEKAGTVGIFLAFSSGVAYAFYVLYYTKSGLSRLDSYKLSLYLSVFSAAGLFCCRGGGTDDSVYDADRLGAYNRLFVYGVGACHRIFPDGSPLGRA